MTLAGQVAELLTKARERKGLSRRALAREGEVTPTTLLELEKGRANPTLERLEKLGELYDVDFHVTTRRKRRAANGND